MLTSIRALSLRPFIGCGVRALASGSDAYKVPRYADKIPKKEELDLDTLRKAMRDNYETHGDIPVEADFLIIGGGVIGSSIAYWLTKKAGVGLNVVVLEKDPTYQRCATTRSAGGIRQQFSLAENIQLSMFGAEFLSNYKEYLGDDAPDPQFNPEGYLFMTNSDHGAQQMEENYALQKQMGARVRLYSKDMLKQQFPFVNAEDVKLASYGLQNEGWFDPWSLLQGLKQWNLRNQVGYLQGEFVDCRFETHVEEDDRQTANEAIIRLPDGSFKQITFAYAIIAAGADSGHVGRIFKMGEGDEVLSIPIPVEPRKRSVYSFHAPEAPIVGFPFVIDPTGAYVRREGLGGHFICGKSPNRGDADPRDDDIDCVDDDYFNNVLWPILAKRVPAFENIKLQHSWSGCYDYNYVDENAIIGMHPYFCNVGICTGFSGHGLQMAPAAGRAMAEGLLDRGFRTIDLTRFSFQRILMGQPIKERGIV